MTGAIAAHVRSLDPRLKLAFCLLLGPMFWFVSPAAAAVATACLLGLSVALAHSRPLGLSMVRRLLSFVLVWTGIKIGLNLIPDVPMPEALLDGLILAIRLSGLLLLGISLTLSTSTRTLGMAVAWGLRPVVGRERAWRAALSLSLMIHFLPLCLSTMQNVSDAFRYRCRGCGLAARLTVMPLAVIRNLGQKTWNQTLAVAGRRLDGDHAWEPDFSWSRADTCWLVVLAVLLAAILARWLIPMY